MARNCEKQYGRLNRIILARDREEFEKKNPKRPRLSNLHSADEIKSWLPAIKREIDYNLKQSQVICYPDRKITELRSNVVQLEQDYKRFVSRMKQLDPTIKHVPWTDRPYEPKHTLIEDERDLSSENTAFVIDTHSIINTPILEKFKSREGSSQSVVDCNLQLQDLPLDFNIIPVKLTNRSLSNNDDKKESVRRGKMSVIDEKAVLKTEETLNKIFGQTNRTSTEFELGPKKFTLVDYTNDSDSSEKSD